MHRREGREREVTAILEAPGYEGVAEELTTYVDQQTVVLRLLAEIAKNAPMRFHLCVAHAGDPALQSATHSPASDSAYITHSQMHGASTSEIGQTSRTRHYPSTVFSITSIHPRGHSISPNTLSPCRNTKV